MAKLNMNFKLPPVAKIRAAVDVANSYINAGIPVFPCREKDEEGIDTNTGEFVTWSEKSPLVSNGLNGATTSSRITNILFGQRHPNALIGVPTGEPLGAWVLDLDRHAREDGTMSDGHIWLEQMESIHGPLPKTAKARTANGGTHLFFRHVDGIRNRAAIADGVDSRGTGGYVCAPGSIMADGRRYEWVDWEHDTMPEFADAPTWLVDMLKSKPAPASSATYTGTTQATGSNPAYVDRAVNAELEQLASTPQGGRNAALNDASFTLGRLVGGGHISESEARSSLESIAQQWPNFPKSRGTIARGLKDGMAQPREVPLPDHANDNTRYVDPAPMIQKSLDKKSAPVSLPPSQPAAQQSDTASEPANIDQPPQPRARFDLTWFDDIEEGKPKEEFIKKVLGEREFTTVSGLPGTGKSVIVTDMACHVAKGMDWHGRKVRQGLVIYVAAERKKLTERRMMAFRKKHDVHDVPLLVIGGRLDFTKDLKDARDLIAAVKEAETATNMTCVWIIVDTLTRVFGAGDQNASKDMSRFVQACDEILAETSAHVTAIHHSAWSGERGKGAIDLDGAVDASFMVKKEHGKYKLICDGTNDGEEGDILAFTMESITIGEDEDGEPTTAPVVIKADGMESGEKLANAIRGHNARALEVLRELLASTGGTVDSPHFPSDAVVVREDAWRQAFYDDDKESTKQATLTQRFSRAYKFFKEAGQIEHIGQWVFIK